MSAIVNTNPALEAPAVAVCGDRLRECLSSATFWVAELPRYADRQQRRADFWAIMSGTLAAATGLSIWPVMSDSSSAGVKVLVSVTAVIAAVCALVPRVMSYGELAGQARELSSRYGELKGALMDLVKADHVDQAAAHDVVARFLATQEKKNSLRGLPNRVAIEQAAAMRQRTDTLARVEVEGRIHAAREVHA